MAGKEENRIFVGGLSWETNDRRLEQEFSRFGKVLEVQIMTERESGRPRGFGFVTFSDARAMEDAIREMHNKTLDGREISVNKAQPKMSTDDTGYGYSSGGFSSGGRGSYRGGDGPAPGRSDECFKCGKRGHWARECPSAGGAGRLSSRSRYGEGGGGSGGRGDRFGGSDRYNDRYVDDRYDGGRYGERDRFDRDKGYGGGRDRYANDRYGAPGDRFAADRYGGGPPDRFPPNGYSKERSYDRDGSRNGVYDRDAPLRGGGGYDRDGPIRGSGSYDRDGPRGVGSDRYGAGGPARYEGGYRERPGPYDRPSRGGRPSSYDDRY